MVLEKHVLVLQHIAENPPGRIGTILDENEIPYQLIHVGKQALPDPRQYKAIIVLGGSQHLYEPDKYPYTLTEEAYFKEAIMQGIPYLGICLGGQLLARSLGADVVKLPKPYMGFVTVNFTAKGKADPLYQNLPGHQLAFQWHDDGFALPEGAIEIAYKDHGFNQAFRYKDTAYGLQYHVEPTAEMLDQWLHTPALKQEFIQRYGEEHYRKTEQEAIEFFPVYDYYSTALIKAFLTISKLL